MTQAGERFIKSTFTVTTKAYLLPEYLNSVVTNKISNTRKELIPSRVTFKFEGDATNKQVGLSSQPNSGVDTILGRYTNQKPSTGIIKK